MFTDAIKWSLGTVKWSLDAVKLNLQTFFLNNCYSKNFDNVVYLGLKLDGFRNKVLFYRIQEYHFYIPSFHIILPLS